MKYVNARAVLRLLFAEPGAPVPLTGGDRLVSSRLVEVETFRAVDRLRLLSQLDDQETAVKRKELADLVGMLDLAPIDDLVIDRAKGSGRQPAGARRAARGDGRDPGNRGDR